MAAGALRVFVSHLSGVAVFDPQGDRVGRVRDIVSLQSGESRPPSVLGLVVEVVSRRRVFVPMTRVTGVESGQVIITGVLNMRRFEQRPAETLVLGELLDRRVTLVETGEPVTVLDVGLTQLPARRDWQIEKLFVRRDSGRRDRNGGLRPLLRRRGTPPTEGAGDAGDAEGKAAAGPRAGEKLTVDWSAVTGLAREDPEQGAAQLLATTQELRPADLANMLHHLSPKRRREVAEGLHDDRLASVLEELPDSDRVEVLSALPDERATDVLETMAPDDAADLLAGLPEEDRERLLEDMRPREADPLRRLLTYEESTAGGLMTTEPIVLRPDATVADALARVRQQELPAPLAAQVYVCRPPDETPTGTYLGVIHCQRLLREAPFILAGSVVDTDLQPLPPAATLPELTSYLAAYNIVAAPVVDEGGHLLGAVTVDDVLDHLLPGNWREAPAHQPNGPYAPPDLAPPAPQQPAVHTDTPGGRGEGHATGGRGPGGSRSHG